MLWRYAMVCYRLLGWFKKWVLQPICRGVRHCSHIRGGTPSEPWHGAASSQRCARNSRLLGSFSAMSTTARASRLENIHLAGTSIKHRWFPGGLWIIHSILYEKTYDKKKATKSMNIENIPTPMVLLSEVQRGQGTCKTIVGVHQNINCMHLYIPLNYCTAVT